MATHTTHKTEPRLLDVEASRGYLGNVSRETFYKYVRSGELAVVKLGRRTFVDRAELDRFIDEQGAAS